MSPLRRTIIAFPAPRDAESARQRVLAIAETAPAAEADARILAELESISYCSSVPAEVRWARNLITNGRRGP